MRLGPRIALSALLAATLSGALVGCTIMDELNDANKKMKVGEASPGQKPSPEDSDSSPAAKPKKQEPGVLDKALAWMKKSTTPAPKPHDPNDPIVKCEKQGSVSFVYKFDCQQNGGVVVGEHRA
ncbi:MAG TPA: hypothetical protein DEP35_14675 [Deltaproteobacteria bacterium]|jgi:hypothetical protein|nr:hypothetical protein [Deltaproteobacteria bacterium]